MQYLISIKHTVSFLAVIFLLNGCTPSSIKLVTKKGLSSYDMFGKIGSRDFYIPVSISSEFSLKWEAGINGSFHGSSITAYDNYIFINDLSGRVYCFNASTGKVIGALKHSGAVYTTPVIDENNIIFIVAKDDENKSWLYNYNFVNAKMLYEQEIPGRVMTELIKSDKEVIFNTENGKIFSYTFTGDKVWEYDSKTRIHSSPALKNDIVVFGNDNGEIIGINAVKGNLLFREKIGEAFFGGASIDVNTVFIGNDDGNLYAIDLSSGKIKWKFETGTRIMMIPVFNKTHVIVGNLKGELYSVNKETGKLNWRTNTRGVLNASPLLTDNIIIIPDLSEAYHFIDVKTGKIKNTYHLEGRGKLTPVIFNDVLYIGFDNGIVRAYEFVN